MFIKTFVGQYYDKSHGEVGIHPLNLIFNAIRVLVPTMVMTWPKHIVKSDYAAYRPYGELLGLALDKQAKINKLTTVYRRWIVDALFCLGIVKTGICTSSSNVSLGPNGSLDLGEIYTEPVDFEDWVIDSETRSLDGPTFVGNKVCVSRSMALDSGLFPNDVIEKMGRPSDRRQEGSTRDLSRSSVPQDDKDGLEDKIELLELWIPSAKALVTLPADGTKVKDWLRVVDFYGPDTGPYTYLSFSPPVPNNPIPVSTVGIWHDLAVLADQMAKKIVDQAVAQKDVLGYSPAAADDAQEIVDAANLDAVRMSHPDSVKMFSFGGQRASNEAHLQQLMLWFNTMSGNVEALGGIREDSATATQASILQANQAVQVNDDKDQLYAAVAEEAAKRAWYLHTDPLIEIPLIRRKYQPMQTAIQPDGRIALLRPAGYTDEQVILTPEARRGDFLSFMFEIQPKSMSRMDPHLRANKIMEFSVKFVPAAATAAVTLMQMGVPFSFPKFIQRIAKELDIDWMDEVLYDPEFQMHMISMMNRMPAFDSSKGLVAAGAGNMGSIRQNGQPSNIPAVRTPTQEINSSQQEGSAEGQAALPIRQMM